MRTRCCRLTSCGRSKVFGGCGRQLERRCTVDDFAILSVASIKWRNEILDVIWVINCLMPASRRLAFGCGLNAFKGRCRPPIVTSMVGSSAMVNRGSTEPWNDDRRRLTPELTIGRVRHKIGSKAWIFGLRVCGKWNRRSHELSRAAKSHSAFRPGAEREWDHTCCTTDWMVPRKPATPVLLRVTLVSREDTRYELARNCLASQVFTNHPESAVRRQRLHA